VLLTASAANSATGLISTAVKGSAYSSSQPPVMDFAVVATQSAVFGNFSLCNLA
jgi:hypothetical protein